MKKLMWPSCLKKLAVKHEWQFNMDPMILNMALIMQTNEFKSIASTM